MKINYKKKILLNATLTCLCLVFSAVLIMFCIKLIPGAITYTASTSGDSSVPYYERVSDCHYDSISDISEEGPFTIGADGNNIYIYSGNICLYRIKANLSQFPGADREAILSGIEISDKAFLYEIVGYMES